METGIFFFTLSRQMASTNGVQQRIPNAAVTEDPDPRAMGRTNGRLHDHKDEPWAYTFAMETKSSSSVTLPAAGVKRPRKLQIRMSGQGKL